MSTGSLALVHRVHPGAKSAASKRPTCVMLHGRGSDEEDLLSLAPMLDERFLAIGVRAPYPFPSGGYTWYNLQERGSPDPETFGASYRRLLTFLDQIVMHYAVDPDRIFLFGFSMGAVMSYALGLSSPDKIRAVAANSGYVPEVPFLTYRWQELAHTDFFITHGTEDPVIPITLARRARELLRASTARLVYREYPVSHTLAEEALTDVLAWLRSLLVVEG
jgi:phospholipase/carboxylesterase